MQTAKTVLKNKGKKNMLYWISRYYYKATLTETARPWFKDRSLKQENKTKNMHGSRYLETIVLWGNGTSKSKGDGDVTTRYLLRKTNNGYLIRSTESNSPEDCRSS